LPPQMSRRGTDRSALPIELHPPMSPAAVALLDQARHDLDDADESGDPAFRFVAVYRSALRAGAAILAARGRPHRGHARPESVWNLLTETVPELESWAAVFAANSSRQALAQAGITSRISTDDAAELLRFATEFVALAQQVVHGSS